MLHELLNTWFHWVEVGGYWGVIGLMALESSIFPVPSEVVIPPAAYWAVFGKDGGPPPMTLAGVVAAGTFGSWLGSAITYLVARWVGRPFVLRWGRYFLCPPHKFARAERFLIRYDASAIFFARLLPVVRHLISIPAGIVRMPFGKFSLMTIIGSALWCGVLAWFGLKVAERNPRLLEDPSALVHAMKGEIWWIIGAVVVLAALYFLMLRLTGAKSEGSREDRL
ncbi:MAG: DedA family protein [Verrucomicrobiales bacterium]